MRVVLVDDQKLVRQGFRLILAVEPDITVVGEATNGAEGVDVVKETAPDVVLMDVQMPVMDGYKATQLIRSEQSRVLNHEVPIVAMTAHALAGDKEKCLAVGMDDYIAKPFEPRELILRIQRILDRQNIQGAAGVVKFGTFSFDCESRVLSEAGQRIHITTAEQDLLTCFASAPNQVLSREDISDQLKGRMKGRSIDVAVARLRTKLEAEPRFPVYLQTTRGKGWLLRTN